MDLPQAVRQLIIEYHCDGVNCRRIAELLKRPKSTVIDIVRKYKDTGSLQSERVGRCGRPRLLSVRDERALARASVADPHLTAREIRTQVGGNAAVASVATVKRALRRQGRRTYRPSKSPALNAAKRWSRLQWCRKYRDWDEGKWNLVSHSIIPLQYLCILGT
jgi:transposase